MLRLSYQDASTLEDFVSKNSDKFFLKGGIVALGKKRKAEEAKEEVAMEVQAAMEPNDEPPKKKKKKVRRGAK